MNGRFARADELWMACASKVLPVPVSPSNTTGTSDLAAREANWRQRAMASLLVLRFSSLNLDGRACIVLLPYALTEPPNRFKCIFNERPATDDDMRIAFHSNAQRQSLSCWRRDFILIE